MISTHGANANLLAGQDFGPYPDGHCFYIETSSLYRQIQQGVRVAEMVLLRGKSVDPPVFWVIEAKSSTPRPETQLDFDTFIDEIRDKLTNTLVLLIAARLGRHRNGIEILPELFKNEDLSQAGFRFVLVVNGHEDAWCQPLQDALTRALHATVKTWALKPTAVAVINEKTARVKGLVDVADNTTTG